MAIKDALLPEFDQEMANTRKTLERVPDDKLGWKPHAKSGTMLWLAGHVANIPSWAAVTITQDGIDLAAPFEMPDPKSRKDLLDLFDKNVKEGRKAIEGASDAEFQKPWSLKKGSTVIFSLPKVACMRTFVMNHLIHHRAQLGLYLRLNDIPVPATYGPSADEGSM
jgi:uncharacterized damage-inducible protein DinB